MAEDPGQSLAKSPAAPTLQALINELVLVENWHKLGVNLGLQEHQLCEIERKYHDNSCCKTEMLDHWLGNAENPNWKALFDALCQMGEYTVALTIKTKYSIDQPISPLLMTATTPPLYSKHPTTPVKMPATTQPHLTKFPDHQEHIGPIRPCTVEHQVQYFESKFGSLVDRTYRQVRGNIEPHVFLSRITYLPVSARPQHGSFIEGKLMNIPSPVTFEKIWSILNLYWDFLNYGLLEHVINKCGSDDLKQQMQEYIHELTVFKQTTRLCDFVESWPCRDDGPPEDRFKKVVIKMQHEWSQCTLQDVESFKKALIHKFFLPEFDILLQKAERGCVCITWLTSPSIATLLQQNLANIETEFFKKHSVDAVTIDNQVMHFVTEHVTDDSIREYLPVC